MTEDIKPTRSGLIKLKGQINLAKSGHELLKKKRDCLVLEFFELLKSAKTCRSDLIKLYLDAKKKMEFSRILNTDIKLHSLALSVNDTPTVKLDFKNIMRVKLPIIIGENVSKSIAERNIPITDSTSMIDATIGAYEQLIQQIIYVAEKETAMKRLLIEIEKIRRRVNALEFRVIPEMNEALNYIKLRLEEMERAKFFRLKKLKAKVHMKNLAKNLQTG